MPEHEIIEKAIRKVPDFPKPGVLFYDITGILVDPKAFSYCIDRMEEMYARTSVDAVAAIESRGFIFAAPYAIRRGIPLVLLRKKGKLPGETYRISFTLEYGEDVLEVHRSDLHAGERILLVDDLIATGGTLNAAAQLLALGGAKVIGVFGIVGLPYLHFEKVLSRFPVTTLVQYSGECAE
ncbi:MAG: adenine phosphoribosyltransferase [Spirochaetia bacterium]|jgi:adenine phosphoribosyltransferase